jgi:hypothetical protein
MVSFSARVKSRLMNRPVAPLSSSAVTPFTSAVSVVWISTLRFSEFGERESATMKCFGRLRSHCFSRGDEPFGLLLVDVSVSLAVYDPVSNTRMVSSLSGTIYMVAKRFDRQRQRGHIPHSLCDTKSSKSSFSFMIATKILYYYTQQVAGKYNSSITTYPTIVCAHRSVPVARGVSARRRPR